MKIALKNEQLRYFRQYDYIFCQDHDNNKDNYIKKEWNYFSGMTVFVHTKDSHLKNLQ